MKRGLRIRLILTLAEVYTRRRKSTPEFLPGESHGQRSLVGYGPWGHKESDTAERLNSTAQAYAEKKSD